jgi:hypothetical protein
VTADDEDQAILTYAKIAGLAEAFEFTSPAEIRKQYDFVFEEIDYAP